MKSAQAAPGTKVTVVMAVDRQARTVDVPDDLSTALAEASAAEGTFQTLSYSHRKEYVDWILGAKKAETRTRRIQKTIEMLVAGARLKG